MIVRISGENQYRLSDADAERLNQLEKAVTAVVEGGQQDGFDTAFRTLLDYVREHGTPLGVGVRQPVLILAGDAHDHVCPPSAGACSPWAGEPSPPAPCGLLCAGISPAGAVAGESPMPISFLIFASSSSTSGWLESCLS